METKKTHWRKLAGKHNLVGEMLNNKDVTLTILKAVNENVINIQKTKKNDGEPVYDKKAVLYFVGTDQKLILNTTNMKSISKVLGTPFIEDWENRQITLTPLHGKFFGEMQDVIRIKQDYSQVKV